MSQAGALGIESPANQVRLVRALRDFGPFGGATKMAAIRHGNSPAITDDRGRLTYAELDRQVDQLANAFRARLAPGSSVGILCRNHRGPLLTAFAASRAGMNAVWLNTAFSVRQCVEVSQREGIDFLVHDAEFSGVTRAWQPPLGSAAVDMDQQSDALDELIATGSPTPPPRPAKPGRIVMLTSGTTGTPKGAPRAEPKGFIGPGCLLDRMPMRSRQVTVIAPPLFHGTGLLIAMLSIALSSELVLRRRFSPEQLLSDLVAHRATAVCLVPVMLQRILALGEDEIRRHDTSALDVLFCAGSPLPGSVATRAQELFGDVVYNLYASTEVSFATLATPADVRVAPTSVGRPMLGARVRLYDDGGREVPRGETGRIFVGSSMPFEGYTGGGHKEIIDGMMATGDVGHFDAEGRLFIDGRDDDMIVSGGENVFPAEVEELLASHPAIVEAAALGVPDEEFGQRLCAYVVTTADQTVTEDEVRAYVRDNLARYKVPRDIVFVGELPRNATGKVVKRELVTHDAG
jgi:fatty-acyl-CoA synthase